MRSPTNIKSFRIRNEGRVRKDFQKIHHFSMYINVGGSSFTKKAVNNIHTCMDSWKQKCPLPCGSPLPDTETHVCPKPWGGSSLLLPWASNIEHSVVDFWSEMAGSLLTFSLFIPETSIEGKKEKTIKINFIMYKSMRPLSLESHLPTVSAWGGLCGGLTYPEMSTSQPLEPVVMSDYKARRNCGHKRNWGCKSADLEMQWWTWIIRVSPV